MSVIIRVFDPAMCCSSGVCGPSVDPELARFAADVDWLRKQGISVERFNLSQQPGAFAETSAVKEALARGMGVLPLVLVGDRIVVEGAYPSRETLAALSGVTRRSLEQRSGNPVSPSGGATPTASSGCCDLSAAATSKSRCC